MTDDNRKRLPVPVRDFVGKFFLLGLYSLAGYTPTKMVGDARTPEGNAVNRMLSATTGKNTVRPIFEPNGAIWEATRYWSNEGVGFPGPDVLTSMVRLIDPRAAVFHSQVIPGEISAGEPDQRSLAGRRFARSADGDGDPLPTLDWCNLLKTILVPATISERLGLHVFNDNNKDLLTNVTEDGGEINLSVNMFEFYTLFVGSVLDYGGRAEVSLERTTLSQAYEIGPRGGTVPNRIVPSSQDPHVDDPHVTKVLPNRLIRVARLFGFGCELCEESDLGKFGDRIGRSSSALRIAAWDAFAGERERDGQRYYGGSLSEFARSYAALVQSAIDAEAKEDQGADRQGILGEFYIERDHAGKIQQLASATGKATAGKRNTGVEEVGEQGVFRIEENPRSNLGREDANGVSLTIASGQGMLVLFDYCPRHLDDDDNVIVFPTTRLTLEPVVTGPRIVFDYASWMTGTVPTIDGGEVVVGPGLDEQIKLVRRGPANWDGRPKSFEDLQGLIEVLHAEPHAEFVIALSASLNSDIRFEGQSEEPEAAEALKIALDALKLRAQSGGNRIILKTLRLKVVGAKAIDGHGGKDCIG